MYNSKEKLLIFLTSFDFLTHKKWEEILNIFDDFEDLKNNFDNQKTKLTNLADNQIIEIEKILNDDYINSYTTSLDKSNIICVTQFSNTYPAKLLEVDCPPYVMFCKGDIKLLNTNSIAIVGTRQPTAYGRGITKEFAEGLAKNGLTIVSGLSYGVDRIAHETALDINGKTIAVLGGGFNYIYPSANTSLANTIAEKGLLLTEYRPSYQPKIYTFPQRNRIIAGLSLGTLITEAGEKSGSLHTKEYSLDCGREVFAVPGNINSDKSKATNRLIRSAQGACVLDYKDVLLSLGITPQKTIKKVNNLTIEEALIFDILKDGEKHFEEICDKTKLDSKTLNSYLTTLQIRGIIKKLPSNYYSL